MAKSSKIDDYWRQHNIENLFKDLTHVLVQKMPSDPILAIVQHLQKKFPKSCKSTIENQEPVRPISKSLLNSSKSKVVTSTLDQSTNNLNSSVYVNRRLSNISQLNGTAPITGVGSAFSEIFRQTTDTNHHESMSTLKNLFLINRFSQQATVLGKNIQTQHDIIDEEVIKPIEKAEKLLPVEYTSIESIENESENNEIQQEPTVLQLIKYKQQIRLDNDRRLHHQALANIAQEQWEIERSLEYDESEPSVNVTPQENASDKNPNDETIREKNSTNKDAVKTVSTTFVRSREEEEILNEEDVTHQQNRRYRPRTVPRPAEMPMMKTMQKQLLNTVQTGICKKCGGSLDDQGNTLTTNNSCSNAAPLKVQRQLVSSPKRPLESAEMVDDWFESASVVSGARTMSPWSEGNETQIDDETNSIDKNFFQPIQNIPQNLMEQDFFERSNSPLIPHAPKQRNRTSTPQMSETGSFQRSTDGKIRRLSLTRRLSSPSPKQ